MADMYFVIQPQFDDSGRLRIEGGGPFPAGLHDVLYEGPDGDLAREMAKTLRRGELVRYEPNPATQRVTMMRYRYVDGKGERVGSPRDLSTVNPLVQIATTLTDGRDFTRFHQFARKELAFLGSLSSTQ